MTREQFYHVATAIILFGFVMLIQPFTMFAFRWGVPVMVVGIILHAILDHLPERREGATPDAADKGGPGQ